MNNTEALNYLGLKLTGSPIDENNDLEVLNATAKSLDPEGNYESTNVTDAIYKLGDAYEVGGGSGSSDWSEAICSFSWNGVEGVDITGAIGVEVEGQIGSMSQISTSAGTITQDTDTIHIGLYHGAAMIMIMTAGEIEVSGAIQSIGGPAYAVTGDFSLAITSSK